MTAPRREVLPLRVLFFVEGFTDIRFVVGLSEICDLTMAVPARQYRESGLRERLAGSGARVGVVEIPGRRVEFQFRSLGYLLRHARHHDVILSQEVLRGSLNATVVGRLLGVPVVAYLGVAPVEYFRCRRERRQIGPVTAAIGEGVIRTLMTINGRLASHWVAMGPYLRELGARYCRESSVGSYYGVDTQVFRPVSAAEQRALRERLSLPAARFLVFLSSRISHEKDPETAIEATRLAREQGLDAVLINLSGGYRDFLALAASVGIPRDADWILARPAVDPRTEVAHYFQAANACVLASLAEGAAFSTLEALACGTPTVATAVGGMAVQLDGYARLVPRRDPQALANALLWIGSHPEEARSQALRGRDYVIREWERGRAFNELAALLRRVAAIEGDSSAAARDHGLP